MNDLRPAPIRLFTKTKLPSVRHLVCYCGVLAFLVFVALTPADEFHWALDWPLWMNPRVGSAADVSAAMFWLVAANSTSFIAVFLLLRELRHLDKAVRNQSFVLDANCANERCKVKPAQLTAANFNPVQWALEPLELMYTISMCVLIVTVSLTTLVIFKRPVLGDWLLTAFIFWTGLIYLGLMTTGDLRAGSAYRRATCLRHRWPAEFSDEQKVGYKEQLDELLESLSDYERIIRYVDVPILASVILILIHKSFVLTHGPYYLGFIAGAIAMHTILANAISILIATSTIKPHLEAA